MKAFYSFDKKNKTHNILDENGICLTFSKDIEDVQRWCAENGRAITELQWELFSTHL